jgi:hypothetical protein
MFLASSAISHLELTLLAYYRITHTVCIQQNIIHDHQVHPAVLIYHTGSGHVPTQGTSACRLEEQGGAYDGGAGLAEDAFDDVCEGMVNVVFRMHACLCLAFGSFV